MNKLTKIVATIGPACDSYEMIEKLIQEGVDVFRFNFKHNTIAWHNERIRRVNEVAKKLSLPIGTLIDLQGPEIRIIMPYEQIEIEKGEDLVFGEKVFVEKKKGFSISHPDIIYHLKTGQRLLADDGAFTFLVVKKNDDYYLRSQSQGILKNRKSLNIPGANFPFPVLVERDFKGLQLAQRNQVEFVALSFVRSKEDIQVLRKELEKYKFQSKIIAKIETKKALSNLNEIIELSDGIMVARGDLGVELPLEEVPYYQKMIIKKSIEKGIPVITATQMLQSMIDRPYPTRAEVSDVANATYDLTDAVMLSAESAVGKYPDEAINMMKRTIVYNEKKNLVDSRKRFNFELVDKTAVLCDTAYGLYVLFKQSKKNIGGIIIFTETGKSVRLISRYRPLIPIFAFAPTEKISASLVVNYGTVPFSYSKIRAKKEIKKTDITKVVNFLLQRRLVKKGELLIILHGDYWEVQRGASTLKLVTV